MTGYSLNPLQGLPPLGRGPLPPRDPRFAPGPAELCQLAGTYAGQELGQDWVMEEKYDGIRLLWAGGQLLSREALPMACAEHLRPLFERLERRCGRPMFFDCEYVEPEGFFATIAAHKAGVGKGMAWLFDGLTLGEWQEGSSMPLWQRRQRLNVALDEFRPANLKLVQQLAIVGDIRRTAEAIWEAGGEGLMLKQVTAPYVRARSSAWLKVKRVLELRCTVAEVLKDGAAMHVLYEGRRIRVAVPPPLRSMAKGLGPSAVGMSALVTGMEWSDTGALRQGHVVAIGGS